MKPNQRFPYLFYAALEALCNRRHTSKHYEPFQVLVASPGDGTHTLPIRVLWRLIAEYVPAVRKTTMMRERAHPLSHQLMELEHHWTTEVVLDEHKQLFLRAVPKTAAAKGCPHDCPQCAGEGKNLAD